MKRSAKLIISALILMAMISRAGASEKPSDETTCPYKVYVILGFHTSFYHSWRGDSPDEAGFGTDIRLVRAILKMLNEANAEGKKARGYWEGDNYWTFEEIIPNYSPDIIAGIRERVASGQDEVLLGPYNNGANHAATEDEFRTAVAWSIENPYGSGMKQIFGKIFPLYRSQEGMYTTGQNRIFLEEGVKGMIVYYSSIPFDSISPFVPALSAEVRFNPFWYRSVPDEDPIVVFPAVSPGDLVNYTSLEKWMLDLHKLQTSGKVKSDLVIHINFDADAETWLPVKMPKGLEWFPNSGGLIEYINAVNKYQWADFTVPSEYLKNHPPQAEVLVRQDLADGAYNGNYSWSEKYQSILNWTSLEQSRLFSYRAMALSKRVPKPLAESVSKRLWEGKDSSFFYRLVGLSTTHFGMSTPIINEERQAKAELIIGKARAIGAEAEKEQALAIKKQAKPEKDALYIFELYNFARGKEAKPVSAKMIMRVPLILPAGIDAVSLKSNGKPAPASMVNLKKLYDGSVSGELIFIAELKGEERKAYNVYPAPQTGGSSPGNLKNLKNNWIELKLSEADGVASFSYLGKPVGKSDFLKPFINYRVNNKEQIWSASGYSFEDLSWERWEGAQRSRIKTKIPMQVESGNYESGFSYTFTILDELPYLLIEVDADYAYTLPQDILHTIQQKLRRYLDLKWVEVAPFQLKPALNAPAEKPLRVWKHNYLGITSFYDLNYGAINPKNKNLDSFNHQVTAGWVAVSNGSLGLALAQSAESLASLAFCPMRLREIPSAGAHPSVRPGRADTQVRPHNEQQIYLNPFGSYFGKQFDYSHLGGNNAGTEISTIASAALRANGPSYNGAHEKFSLLLAPYAGDQPPEELQQNLSAFFYPFGIIYLKTPAGIESVVREDMLSLIAAKEKEERMLSDAPLPSPTAFLANPIDGAVGLVWDPPRDERVSGYEIRWKRQDDPEWQTEKIGPGHRCHIADLTNGQIYLFKMRALAQGRESDWTQEISCIPGPVKEVSIFSAASGISVKTILKVVYYGIVHAMTTR